MILSLEMDTRISRCNQHYGAKNMYLRNCCVSKRRTLQFVFASILLGMGMLTASTHAQELIAQTAAMHRHVKHSQTLLVHPMDSTDGMYGGAWKMAKVALQSQATPTPKLGTLQAARFAWTSAPSCYRPGQPGWGSLERPPPDLFQRSLSIALVVQTC